MLSLDIQWNDGSGDKVAKASAVPPYRATVTDVGVFSEDPGRHPVQKIVLTGRYSVQDIQQASAALSTAWKTINETIRPQISITGVLNCRGAVSRILDLLHDMGKYDAALGQVLALKGGARDAAIEAIRCLHRFVCITELVIVNTLAPDMSERELDVIRWGQDVYKSVTAMVLELQKPDLDMDAWVERLSNLGPYDPNALILLVVKLIRRGKIGYRSEYLHHRAVLDFTMRERKDKECTEESYAMAAAIIDQLFTDKPVAVPERWDAERDTMPWSLLYGAVVADKLPRRAPLVLALCQYGKFLPSFELYTMALAWDSLVFRAALVRACALPFQEYPLPGHVPLMMEWLRTCDERGDGRMTDDERRQLREVLQRCTGMDPDGASVGGGDEVPVPAWVVQEKPQIKASDLKDFALMRKRLPWVTVQDVTITSTDGLEDVHKDLEGITLAGEIAVDPKNPTQRVNEVYRSLVGCMAFFPAIEPKDGYAHWALIASRLRLTPRMMNDGLFTALGNIDQRMKFADGAVLRAWQTVMADAHRALAERKKKPRRAQSSSSVALASPTSAGSRRSRKADGTSSAAKKTRVALKPRTPATVVAVAPSA